MKRSQPLILLLVLSLAVLISQSRAADTGHLTIDLQHPAFKISPLFYGLMTEEINHSYDGGLYAELIRNRAFNDFPNTPPPALLDAHRGPPHWSSITGATLALEDSVPDKTALKKSLKFTGSVANDGYWGIPVLPNTQYHASLYAKADGQFPLTLSIQSTDGSATYATATIPQIDTNWKKYDAVLTTKDLTATADARFVITAGNNQTAWITLVSLFPPTFNNRPNGNRIDLMNTLADLHPRFLRFPGGNYLEGNTVAERFEWKDTIGPIDQRPGHQGPWGYRSSDGLGLLEFLNWCEDLHMQPLLAVYAGYSLRHIHVDAGDKLQPFVQDALDEIEYCTGDASTTWGARRAADGHPAPFNIQYVEIGNEDEFDRPNGNYDQRFAQFFDAIKAKYPNLQLIATAPVHTRTPDVIDDHYYRSSHATERDVHHYDKISRSGPKIFVGEWATTEGSPTPNLGAALADAAWLTGLERNSDLVIMNCYAPLLVNVNPSGRQWGTNLIGYNALNSFGSTSYYAQQMLNQNIGDTELPVDVADQTPDTMPPAPPSGNIGVMTWNTQAQFKDIKVTAGDNTLFQSDFSQNDNGWRERNGKWSVQDGALSQSAETEDCRMTAGNQSWTDYTLTLKSRKTAGQEGFIILFHVRGRNDYVSWNIGGWGNTHSALEKLADGQKFEVGQSNPLTVNDTNWHDIKIELAGTDIKCYFDGNLVTEATDPPPPPLDSIYAAASRVDATGEVIAKVVNVSAQPQTLQINLQNASNVVADAQCIVLTGNPKDVNSIDEPKKVFPQQADIHDAAASFTHEFPPHSVTVLRLNVKP